MSRLPCNHLPGDPNPANCPNCGDGFHRIVSPDATSIQWGLRIGTKFEPYPSRQIAELDLHRPGSVLVHREVGPWIETPHNTHC